MWQLSPSCVTSFNSQTSPCEVGEIIMPVTQFKKLRHRKVKVPKVTSHAWKVTDRAQAASEPRQGVEIIYTGEL